ncbi:MAG: HD domain-containing protein [Bacteroidales bacterium]|jgi:uncharacterized protein|nr:HD domain-containing protein [Bacteroidales bacterium]
MDINAVIRKYFPYGSESYNIYYAHVTAVADTVAKICEHNKHLKINKLFAINASLLHDIGICMVNAPQIHCTGFAPYIQHGIMGRIILEDENINEYSSVCERHIGTGLYKEDIINGKLPLPIKDMYPVSLEEKVVAYADKFFSKSKHNLSKPKEINLIREEIAKHGKKHIDTFDNWCNLFGYEYLY